MRFRFNDFIIGYSPEVSFEFFSDFHHFLTSLYKFRPSPPRPISLINLISFGVNFHHFPAAVENASSLCSTSGYDLEAILYFIFDSFQKFNTDEIWALFASLYLPARYNHLRVDLPPLPCGCLEYIVALFHLKIRLGSKCLPYFQVF